MTLLETQNVSFPRNSRPLTTDVAPWATWLCVFVCVCVCVCVCKGLCALLRGETNTRQMHTSSGKFTAHDLDTSLFWCTCAMHDSNKLRQEQWVIFERTGCWIFLFYLQCVVDSWPEIHHLLATKCVDLWPIAYAVRCDMFMGGSVRRRARLQKNRSLSKWWNWCLPEWERIESARPWWWWKSWWTTSRRPAAGCCCTCCTFRRSLEIPSCQKFVSKLALIKKMDSFESQRIKTSVRRTSDAMTWHAGSWISGHHFKHRGKKKISEGRNAAILFQLRFRRELFWRGKSSFEPQSEPFGAGSRQRCLWAQEQSSVSYVARVFSRYLSSHPLNFGFLIRSVTLRLPRIPSFHWPKDDTSHGKFQASSYRCHIYKCGRRTLLQCDHFGLFVLGKGQIRTSGPGKHHSLSESAPGNWHAAKMGSDACVVHFHSVLQKNWFLKTKNQRQPNIQRHVNTGTTHAVTHVDFDHSWKNRNRVQKLNVRGQSGHIFLAWKKNEDGHILLELHVLL